MGCRRGVSGYPDTAKPDVRFPRQRSDGRSGDLAVCQSPVRFEHVDVPRYPALMASLTLRALDDRLLDRLRARAAENRRTVEDEASAILAQTLPPHGAVVDEMRAVHRKLVARYGYLPDSVELLRTTRDEE